MKKHLNTLRSTIKSRKKHIKSIVRKNLLQVRKTFMQNPALHIPLQSSPHLKRRSLPRKISGIAYGQGIH